MGMSRRYSLPLATLIAITGCAPAAAPQSGGSAATSPAVTVEQKAVFGIGNITEQFDPYVAVGLNGRRYDLYDCLVLPDQKGDPQPAIATAWKIVDDTTWEFTIRTGMKFHDGSALSADDVKFSLDRAINPDLKLAIASRIPTIDSTTVVNATTVRVKTKQSDPILLRRLAAVAILPKVYFEKVGEKEFALKPVGSGPFKLKEWKQSDSIVMSAFNEHAFRKPILQEFTLKNVPEETARVAGLQTGDLDYSNLISAEQSNRLKTGDYALVNFNAGSSVGFFMDSVRDGQPFPGPTQNKLVRQAINYAIDKETINKQIFGGFATPEGQVAQPETFGFSPTIKAYPFDPAKAKQLLAQAGYPNGFQMKGEASTTVGPEFRSLGLIVQQYLKDVGIDLDFQLIGDAALQREKFYGTKPREALLGIPLSNRPAMDADFAISWFWSKQPGGTQHYNNPEFDRYYELSRTEMDSAKRLAALQKAMEVMHEDPPFLFVVAGASLDVYNTKKLKGVEAWVERDQRFDKISKIG